MNKLKNLMLLNLVKDLYNIIKNKIHKVLLNSQINENNLIIDNNETDIIKHEKQLSDDLIIPDKPHKMQEKNYHINLVSYLTKEKLQRWIFEKYPSHFLTIQFPRNYRSENYYTSVELLRKIMSRFEYHLLKSRYWNKKHVPFIAITEKGRSVNWHFHILIDLDEYDLRYIKKTIRQTFKDMRMSINTMHIEPFTEEGKSYSTKEIEINGHKIRTDRIIPSNVLFNIPVKQ